MRRSLLVGACVGLGLLLASGPAAADDGPLSGVDLAVRPPTTILRPLSLGPVVGPAREHLGECIVTVGGLGSDPTDPKDRPFDRLLEPYLKDPRYRVIPFGTEAGFAYATRGAVNANAKVLRDQVRAIAPGCAAIHVVAHSMGGLVADRAFARGLSSDQRVATYMPMSAPHNGATLAKAVQHVVTMDADLAGDLRTTASALGVHDPDSPAVRDLARSWRPPRPPRGVSAARIYMATDVLVPLWDAASPGWELRVYPPDDPTDGEGHGATLRDERVHRIVREAIERRAVPIDERADHERAPSPAYALVASGITMVLAAALFAGGAVLATHYGQRRVVESVIQRVGPLVMDRGLSLRSQGPLRLGVIRDRGRSPALPSAIGGR